MHRNSPAVPGTTGLYSVFPAFRMAGWGILHEFRDFKPLYLAAGRF